MVKVSLQLIFVVLAISAQGQELEVRKVIEPGENNPRNSEGDFIQLSKDTILFVYTHFYGDHSSDFAPSYLAGIYSYDRGKTWSQQPVKILENEGEMNTMSVSLLRLKNGDIALFYLRKNSHDDCVPYMRISTDEGKSWGDALKIITDINGYFVLNNDRVIQLSSGRLLVPVSLHKTSQTKWHGMGTIYCYYSDDNGITWLRGKPVSNPENVDLQEPGVVAISEDEVLMFMRSSTGFQMFSRSFDQGHTWTTVEKSSMKSPRSPATIERGPSGNLVAVWNHNTTEDKYGDTFRTPLSIGVSDDGGNTWKNIRNIESDPEGWFCYIAMDFTPEGLLLGYCAGNRQKKTYLDITRISFVKYLP